MTLRDFEYDYIDYSLYLTTGNIDDIHLHFYPGLEWIVRDVRPDLVHMDEEPYNVATAQALWIARASGARTLFLTWQNLNRRYPLPFRLLERYAYAATDGAIAGNRDAGRGGHRQGLVTQQRAKDQPVAIGHRPRRHLRRMGHRKHLHFFRKT